MASPLVRAQTATGAAAPAQTEPPKDALGRDTPRGTVLGFMSAARNSNDEISPLYLDTSETGQAAVDLAQKLYVVLDSRLPARLNEVSDRPEGAADNPLRPNEDVVGTVTTARGSFDVVVVRVTRGKSAPVWLFSRQTLSFMPDAADEIHLTLDRYIPGFLAKPRIAGVRLSAWLTLFLVLPLCYRLLGALNWLFKPFLALWRRRSGASAGQPDFQVPKLVRLVLLGIAIQWVLATIDLPLLERQFWSSIVVLLMIVAACWSLLLLNGYGEGYIRRRVFAGNEEATSLLRLSRRFVDALVVASCGLVVLRYFGFNPTAALAGLGIGGIAVALAAQKTLENVIAGLSLIFDKAVCVGDSLKFGETVGTVDHIGLRSTRIRTLDRTVLSVPNGQIASVSVETLSARDKFWLHHMIGLRYETTVDQMRSVIEGVHQLLLTHDRVDSGSVRVRFFRIGSFSLDIEVFAYVFARDWDRFLEVQQELLLRIMAIVEGAGTAIAFPSQTLHIAEGRVPGPNAQAASPGPTPSSVPREAGKPM